MPKKQRFIPGTSFGGVVRGGGSETIEWARNGPLRLQRSYTKYGLGIPLTRYLAGNRVYCSAPSTNYFPGGADSDSAVRSNGTTAVARSHPTSPSVNLLNSAGELAADGLPSTADFRRWERDCRAILAQAGRAWVGIQFAWLPLLWEIQAWARQVEESDAILREAKRLKSENVIRVGYSFPSDEKTHIDTSNLNAIRWTDGVPLGNFARGATTYKYSRRTWFEAKYQNLVPITSENLTSSEEFALKARALYGVDLTPATLWELAPWSWAVDWVTNFGDVISSVSNTLSDGMVMYDGFVMHHLRKEAVRVATSQHFTGTWTFARFSPTSAYQLVEEKKRFPSIPYFGFGSPGELSAKQVSILAALGISRA